METFNYNSTERAPSSVERFIPPSLIFVKRAAKRLQKAYYVATGANIKLSQAQESLARIYRHADWFSLTKAVGREGASISLFDSELDPSQRKERFEGQIDAVKAIFGVFFNEAITILNYGSLTSSPTKNSSANNSAKKIGVHIDLPCALPRPGMNEVLFTAHTFSFSTINCPLPGWKQYVLIAAPLDNTALWVRFSDEKNIATEAQILISAVKKISDGALKTAYVASNVRSQSPDLENVLPALGVTLVGGRQAIMAARLSGRLSSALMHATMDLGENEPPPSIDELCRLFHHADALVEIPDLKNRSYGAVDFRKLDFSSHLIQLIRELRWEASDKSVAYLQTTKNTPKQANIDEDRDVSFNSAVRKIPAGVPVYRIRIELPLEDFDDLGEVRRVTISRLIDVPTYYNLWDLHVAIQDAMGWSDYHLHQFTFVNLKTVKKKITFSSPNEDDPDESTSVNELLANQVVSMATYCAEYLYDFGDSWKHQLTMVATVPSDGGGYPRCVEGEYACPPEDCGSDSGYFRVVDVMSGKKQNYDGERKEMMEWLKGHPNVDWPYRPNHFEPSNVRFDDPDERWEYSYSN